MLAGAPLLGTVVDFGGLPLKDSEIRLFRVPEDRPTPISVPSRGYLADWQKVEKFLRGSMKYAAITLRTEKPKDGEHVSASAVFFGGVDYAFGVVMPMRAPDNYIESVPEWAK